jgi:uncharacterized protein (DUF1330 family)
MILHVVLFRPRPGISDADRRAMLEAVRVASTEIPSVKRFQIGKRVTHGRDYETAMTEDYTYAAIIEFEDLQALKAYLNHAKHQKLSELFYAVSEAGLVYDYEMAVEASTL